MSAVCPACGVPVLPGYVRCPKCHAGLPLGPGRTKRTTGDPGGTAVPQRKFPLSAVLVALGVAGVIILAFGVRSTRKEIEAAPPPPLQPIAATPNPPRQAVAVPVSPPSPTAAALDVVQTQRTAAADLEDALRRQRLWGRVVITGPRIDVRSGSCADPGMRPLIEGKTTLLHGAGLTKLRCVEQSGAVVFERDL